MHFLRRYLKDKWHRFHEWGVTKEELQLTYPCDRVPNLPKTVYFRGIDIATSVEQVFPWLCQMRIAPYSYDWLDNFGKQSPQHLTQELTNLELGQIFMTGFKLVDFEKNSHVTIRSRDELDWWMRVFGDLVVSYCLFPVDKSSCRLVVKLRLAYPTGAIMRVLMKMLLPPGDTFMMHKQISNFKRLSENQLKASN
ncbi:hypothetical protein [Aliikangiella sp. IMCC44359]|uniref:hypothetical protein n=1 Tax=Aliikangiella sp. IMCC44359 TaxID=3459125 RepID=UPI00403B378A